MYAKFTTIECLPVEYGLVGVFSIFGSLLFYQEYKDPMADVFMVSCSCGGILVGIAIMVSGKHKNLEQTRARRIERLHASMIRGAPIRTERPKALPKMPQEGQRVKAPQKRGSTMDLLQRTPGSFSSRKIRSAEGVGLVSGEARLAETVKQAQMQLQPGSTGNAEAKAAAMLAELLRKQREEMVAGQHWLFADLGGGDEAVRGQEQP